MAAGVGIAGSAALVLVEGVVPIRPEPALFEAAHRRFTRRVSVHSGRPKGKARRSHSLPLLTYSRLGGLPQDPGRAAESSAGPRTDEDMGARRACVVVDVWGTR